MLAPDIKAFSSIWRPKIQSDLLASRVISALWHTREHYVASVIARARNENAVIDAVIESDQIETVRHVLQHFQALLSLPTERADELGNEPLAFVKAHGTRRARAGVPLLAVLQAYRTGHKSFWSAICGTINRFSATAESSLQTTMLLSDYCIDYTDLISTTVTESYLAEQALLTAQRARVGFAVVDDLVRGEPLRTPEALALCAAEGICDGRAMVMAVAKQSGPASAKQLVSQERGKLALAIENALPRSEFGRIVELRLDEIVAVVSCPESAGERTVAAIRARISQINNSASEAFCVGIGLDVRDVTALPRSYAEALAAIDLLGVDQQVSHLAEVSIDTYLRSTPDETARRLIPPWTKAIKVKRHMLTLQAFADSSLNVKACANILNVHTNTIYHRLNRIQQLTGINPRTYVGLTHLLTAVSISSALEVRLAPEAEFASNEEMPGRRSWKGAAANYRVPVRRWT